MEEMEELDTEGPSIQELTTQIRGLLYRIQESMTVLFLRFRQTVLQTAILICVLLLLLWVAIFLYGSFYYSFMPTANFIAPVHFFYRTDCPSPHHSICSFPMANFSLLRNNKRQAMTYGQPYQITLELEMPESPANEQLGMFLVTMSCYSHLGQIVDTTSRSTMLHYRSNLLQSLGTLMFFPLLLMGAAEQKQHILVELFSSYIDDSYKPTIGAVIQIHSHQVQIYKAQLFIHAHFTGIRYVLYHFPLLSAVVGVMSNFIFLSVLILIGYLQVTLGDVWTSRPVGTWNKIRQRTSDLPEAMEQNERDMHSKYNRTETKTHLLCASVMGSGDMDSDSGKMEESILDTEVEKEGENMEPKCFTDGQSTSEAEDQEIYLLHRFLSENVSDSSLPSATPTGKTYHTATCLSS